MYGPILKHCGAAGDLSDSASRPDSVSRWATVSDAARSAGGAAAIASAGAMAAGGNAVATSAASVAGRSAAVTAGAVTSIALTISIGRASGRAQVGKYV